MLKTVITGALDLVELAWTLAAVVALAFVLAIVLGG